MTRPSCSAIWPPPWRRGRSRDSPSRSDPGRAHRVPGLRHVEAVAAMSGDTYDYDNAEDDAPHAYEIFRVRDGKRVAWADSKDEAQLKIKAAESDGVVPE